MRAYHLKTMPLLATFILSWGTAHGGVGGAAGPEAGGPAPSPESCLTSYYPGFKGGEPVWGFMPGAAEREAVCRAEFMSSEVRLAREEIGGDDNSPVTLELRKLWLMERIRRQADGSDRGAATVFKSGAGRRSPNSILGIRPGARPEQVPRLETGGRREHLPDLSRTLNEGKAPVIYHFRRSDEWVAAVCIEPGEGGSCREIVPRDQYEKKHGAKIGEEATGFKGFMKRVKSSFSGPPPKAISESKNVDFCGVRLTDVAYAFDHDLTYIGFFARIAVRRPFAVTEEPQYIRDVFGGLIKQFGEPVLKWKGPSGRPGVAESQAIWITEDGFRIDAICENMDKESGLCRNGRIAARRLPPARLTRPVEGAEFFE